MNDPEIVELLGQTDLFGVLDEKARKLIAGNVRISRFVRGQPIFDQDERGDELYILARGGVKLLIRSRDGDVIEVARHQPPAIFGELALLDGGLRSATAVAIESTTLIAVARERLFDLLRTDPRLFDGLLRMLSLMVRRANEHMADLVFLQVQGRLARKLLELDRTGALRGCKQTELANMVSAARQTVSLALGAMEERGFIKKVGGIIEIVKPAQLERLAKR
jgi:CRP/FNR family cyclic AMP-dependent transcriptional regulator